MITNRLLQLFSKNTTLICFPEELALKIFYVGNKVDYGIIVVLVYQSRLGLLANKIITKGHLCVDSLIF